MCQAPSEHSGKHEDESDMVHDLKMLTTYQENKRGTYMIVMPGRKWEMVKGEVQIEFYEDWKEEAVASRWKYDEALTCLESNQVPQRWWTSNTLQFSSIKIGRRQLKLEILPPDVAPENIHQNAPQLDGNESKPHIP